MGDAARMRGSDNVGKQCVADAATPVLGRNRNGSQQCHIAVDFEAGAPNDHTLQRGYRETFEMVMRPGERQAIVLEQCGHGAPIIWPGRAQ